MDYMFRFYLFLDILAWLYSEAISQFKAYIYSCTHYACMASNTYVVMSFSYPVFFMEIPGEKRLSALVAEKKISLISPRDIKNPFILMQSPELGNTASSASKNACMISDLNLRTMS